MPVLGSSSTISEEDSSVCSIIRLEKYNGRFALELRVTRAASSARTCELQMLIASVHERQFLECYCACLRHQRCQLKETEISVRRRFLGSARISYAFSKEMGIPDVKHKGGSGISALNTRVYARAAA
jgi:hypothetical protein